MWVFCSRPFSEAHLHKEMFGLLWINWKGKLWLVQWFGTKIWWFFVVFTRHWSLLICSAIVWQPDGVEQQSDGDRARCYRWHGAMVSPKHIKTPNTPNTPNTQFPNQSTPGSQNLGSRNPLPEPCQTWFPKHLEVPIRLLPLGQKSTEKLSKSYLPMVK